MEAKEKALDIFVKMLETIPTDLIPENNVAAAFAKLHAIISVDEIVHEKSLCGIKDLSESIRKQYWQEVKQHLQSL